MRNLSKPELKHFTDFIEELEAVIEADTEQDCLFPIYLIDRKDIVKQILEELYDD